MNLTPDEKVFLTNVLKQINIPASSPDAAQVVAAVQSILSKLQAPEVPDVKV